ncbi:class I SAM-dependent methyltransferase [Lysobacter sp. Hz 25]|uniref:class I SAM-dependent methyltransferase n=1 Tax=Lysobacter sp. Hz 25 TaxID=3383698 RepID=UPI0038D3604D
MSRPDRKPRLHWDSLAQIDPDAAVIDPHDLRGLKNQYLAGIRDAAFRQSLQRYGVEHGTLLDLGCGTGSATRPLINAGHRVIGVDISKSLLRHARARCNEDDCLFVQTDGLQLPIADRSLDATVIYGVLIYLVDDAQAQALLSQVRAALKPGAPLIMIEQVRRHRRLTEQGLKCQRSRQEWISLVEAAGFSVQEHRILRHGRFPATPLIRAGLIPRRLWPLAHYLETRIAARTGVFPWDYAEALFVATA